MKNLLFVDDEPKVLDGLKRSLRPMREEWHMIFVTSAAEALKVFEQTSIDVIVSDMRMPVMDGAQLLNEVRQRFPHIIRIILSGHSDQEGIYRSITATHQYLNKPCETEELKAIVTRACALREILRDQPLRALVTSMQQIPSLPTLYSEVRREAESQTASMKSIAKIICRDIGMTAKVLQLVNSPYFGLRNSVSTAEEAVNLLGIDTIQALVLTEQIFKSLPTTKVSGFNTERLWQESTGTAMIAREIAKAEMAPTSMVEQSYTAGLLHDVGSLVFACNLWERYIAVIKTSKESGTPIWEEERRKLGASHAEVGAYLLGLWGLVDPIVEAVAFHHHPSDCVEKKFSPLTAVHIANMLEEELSQPRTGCRPSQIDSMYLSTLQLSDRLPYWREVVVTAQQAARKE
ncbi:MAG: HDOD domain-containing protein [Nitrospira sp.]|nr:HDOD domain-containing protein [Nitrospira sp.]